MLRVTPLILIITLILPPLITSAAPGTSLSSGLLLAALLWSFVSLSTRYPPYSLKKSAANRLALVLLVIGALTVHALISNMLIGGVDFGRLSVSCAILLIECSAALLAADKLLRVPDSVPTRAANAALVFLSLTGIAAIAGVPTVGGIAFAKGVVFFSEPSHYALAFLPVLLVSVSAAPRPTQLGLVSLALAIAALLQNLTMVVGTLVIAALLLRGAALAVMLLALAGAALAGAAAALDFTYYSDRLNFTSDTNNLSTLVFLQGWENALLNFGETHGLGVGFQQFGIAGSKGDITEKIAALLGGDYINLLDGGSTATKILAEFGAFGILLLIGYIALAARSMRFIRKQQRMPAAHRDLRGLFFHSVIVTYLFEIFIRGMGYFSAGGFLTLTALMALSTQRAGGAVRHALRRKSTSIEHKAPAKNPIGSHKDSFGDDLSSGGTAGSITFKA
jgi:hypothetical protein